MEEHATAIAANSATVARGERSHIDSSSQGETRPLPGELIHALVERHAATTPDAPAVRFLDRELDYRELNGRANRLAHALLERGLAGRRVLVCVEPSFDVVVALLGILKSGSVYVPVDPSYPAARIRAIAADTRPGLVVTQRHLQEHPGLEGLPTLVVDELPADPGELTHNPELGLVPESPAYVFYTSGTTGQPKGVVGTHGNLRQYIGVAARRYELRADDVLPAIARFSFSISLFELLTPLVAGATLLVLERATILNPKTLSQALEGVTFFHAGPSLLKGFVRHVRAHYPDGAAFARVRHASSGGDMVPAELLEELKDIFANAEIFVIYGASEIACMGTTYPVPRARRVTRTYVGKPFDNVCVRVVDPADRVVPAGVTGDVLFAGDGVTPGYLNRPELATDKFVMLDGQRFYRTGDRGRMSPEGFLELVGRSDFQTKVRGMRVELGEVEQALRRAPSVREAVVSARPTEDGEKMLVAYVVPETSGAAAAPDAKRERIAAIRAHLQAELPDYMLPAVYVELDRLPLNHNLKIDRRALPDPGEADFHALCHASAREPNTRAERALVAHSCRLLKLREVSVDDNFFEIGGDSLLAVELSLAVEAELGVRLESIDILREPLAVLARLCERDGAARSAPSQPSRAPSVSERVETFHFGQGASLYGALHGRGAQHVETAALICGPVGQEAARTRFVLKRLCKALARSGVPSLLFDYYGTGDSLGESAEADLARFRQDIAEAHAELVRRTGAPRVVAVGVRLGALLLDSTAQRLDLAKRVYWDPVRDGAAHLSLLARLTRAHLRSISHLGFPVGLRRRARRNELLGTVYSDRALAELAALRLEPARPPHVACLEVDCRWSELAHIEDVIPDTSIAETLAALVTEAG